MEFHITGLPSSFGPGYCRIYPSDFLCRTQIHDKHIRIKRIFVFLTNNFTLPSKSISFLYKCRWSIEVFFRWVKQNLRIKSFFGTSPNAVKTQLWIVMEVYALVVSTRRQLGLKSSHLPKRLFNSAAPSSSLFFSTFARALFNCIPSRSGVVFIGCQLLMGQPVVKQPDGCRSPLFANYFRLA